VSINRYDEYKEAEADSLGRLPKHWNYSLLKRWITVKSGDMISSDEETESGTPIIGGNGIRSYTNKSNTPGNTLVIGRVGAKCGCVHHIQEPFWASEHAFRVVEKKSINKRYLFHLLSSLDLNQFAIKTAQPLLNTEIVETQWIFNPPLSEQKLIANFLDRETAKIDALIAEQQRLIELLQEKRLVVISHAVTKGLNPNAPMKDSGVEWLGEVPEHWSIKRLKHISPRLTVGIVVNPSSYISNDGLPFIYGGDIREGIINWQGARRIKAEHSDEQAKTRLVAGDLLMVRVGAPGITAVVPVECEGGNCASVMLIRGGNFSSNWLCYALNTRIVRFQVEVVQYGAAQEQFNIGHAVDFSVPVPPREEQEEIALALACQTQAIDSLIAQSEKGISLLEERRSALISAAVTGQIDVRGLVTEAIEQ